jgi:hypothetical protein
VSPGGATLPAAAPAAYATLPGLGSVPRALIIGLIVAACALGWLMRQAGIALLGGAGTCRYGLTTGVPDLRKE